VSDQDFFFDEDEAAAEPAETPSRSDSGKKGVSSKPAPAKSAPAKPVAATQPAADAGSLLDQDVTLTIALLMSVIALLFGLIGGYLLGMSSASTAVPASVAAPADTGAAGAAGEAGGATPLTPEQVQGGMPAGHPAVGSAAGSQTATATP
jgi:hypothetical protein